MIITFEGELEFEGVVEKNDGGGGLGLEPQQLHYDSLP